MSITIRHVALRAGVSIATVSRVLNGTSPVSEDKRDAVLKAVEALGYTPNPAALSLLGKKTGGIGVLLPYVSGEFFAELLNGLDKAAQDHGYFLIVSTSHRRTSDLKAAFNVMDKRVDGMVIMAPELNAQGARDIMKSGTPVSFINTYLCDLSPDELPVEVLNFENYQGSYALTRHLLESGRRTIALLKGPAGAGDARERTRGYRAAMAEVDVHDTAHLEFEGGYTQADGFAAAQTVVASNVRPEAIVAANDYCAMGAISALTQAGISVPDDIAVAGFDGVTSGQYTSPPLTTVRAPTREIGYQAISRLVQRLRSNEHTCSLDRTDLPVKLIVRGST